MTERLFDLDAYCYRFEATVLHCRRVGGGYHVILDRTAFFPEGGGQAGDVGTLGGLAVYDTTESGGEILHATHAPLPIGQTVVGEVDAAPRFDRMQNHSGEHIVSGLVHRLFGYSNVGFHLGEEEMTLDFDGLLDRAALDRVEDLANEAVFADLPVLVRYPDADELATLDYRAKRSIEGPVRIVSIPGYDVCACCAPHVARTGEIGLIKLLDFIHYKGGVRIRVLCGARALRDYRAKFREVAAVSRACSVPQEECAAAVDRLLAELGEKKQAEAALTRALVAERASHLVPNGAGNIVSFVENASDLVLRSTALLAAPRVEEGVAAILSGSEAEGYRFAIAAKGRPLRALAVDLRVALGARGGGSDELISGRLSAARAAIEAYFQKKI